VDAITRLLAGACLVYHFMHKNFPDHDVVTHRDKEYSRWEDGRRITTNTVEGLFGLVKRGVFGTYHHWERGYLQQYRFRTHSAGTAGNGRQTADTAGTKTRFGVDSGLYC
jgi:ISXO2-like transposase domain